LITATIVFYVAPANYGAIGPLSLALTAAAFLVAYLVSHRPGARKEARELGEEFVLTAAMGGFLVHSLADGAALFSFSGPETVAIGPAIALDRFAVGFFVWTMLHPRYGAKVALGMLVLASLVTVAGYHLMNYVSQAVGDPVIIGVMQSLLAGLVLCIALDHKGHSHGNALLMPFCN
jgi:zinc transporter ZupT